MTTTNPLSVLIGKIVNNGMMSMTIDAFCEKQGTIKSGAKLPYIHLIGDDNSELELHPQHALKLLKTGEHKGMKILTDLIGDEQQTVDCSPFVEQDEEDINVVEVVPEEIELTTAPTVVPVEQPKKAKINKRELTEQIYLDGHKKGLVRKDIILLMKAELNMSDAGANTYYQNAKTKLG